MPDPRKIICIGLNYLDHAKESGVPAPSEPILFSKYATALIGHGGSIVLPAASHEVDYEAELVVVIGRGGRHIARERALEHVGGYAVGHDVSARTGSSTSRASNGWPARRSTPSRRSVPSWSRPTRFPTPTTWASACG